jgi:hypothetical protein
MWIFMKNLPTGGIGSATLLLESPVRAAIRAGPGNAVASHPPGVFLQAGLADLKPAGADPAELLPPAAAVAPEGTPGLPALCWWHNGVSHGMVLISPQRKADI